MPVIASSDAVRGGQPSFEQARVLFLGDDYALLQDEVVGQGTNEDVSISIPQIMRRALQLEAAGIILVHNHPSGDSSPSDADLEVTRRVALAGRVLEIAVHDHVIIGAEECSSLREMGLI